MQHSRAITRKSASNLALAFILLPRPKRDAMSALYAFCREVDDVADDESVPTAKNGANNSPPGATTSAARSKTSRRSLSSTRNFSPSSAVSSALRAVRRIDQGLRNGSGHDSVTRIMNSLNSIAIASPPWSVC